MYEEMPQKDYMGTISWSRSSCSEPRTMFGSEIKTTSPVTVRIDRAHVVKLSERDYNVLSDNRPYIEVELTPVQWAEFLTSGNVCGGVPCTVHSVEGKQMSKVEPTDIAEIYNVAVRERFDEFEKGIKRFEQRIAAALVKGKAMTKTELKEMLSDLSVFRTNTVANVNYVRDRFVEDMGSVVAKARAEVNAYAERTLINTGVQCLMNEATDELP